MTTELLQLVSLYLQNQKAISEIREWVAQKVWETDASQRDLIDFVACELAYLDSGVSDEELFRERLAIRFTQTLFAVVNEGSEYTSNVGESDSASNVFSFQIDGPVEDLRLEGAFA